MRWPFSAPFNLCLMGCVAFRGGEAITILAMKLRNGNGVSYLAQVSGCKRFSVLPTATHADTQTHKRKRYDSAIISNTVTSAPTWHLHSNHAPILHVFPLNTAMHYIFSLMQVLSVFVVVVRPLTGFNCTI